jgi:hypothetical protein
VGLHGHPLAPCSCVGGEGCCRVFYNCHIRLRARSVAGTLYGHCVFGCGIRRQTCSRLALHGSVAPTWWLCELRWCFERALGLWVQYMHMFHTSHDRQRRTPHQLHLQLLPPTWWICRECVFSVHNAYRCSTCTCFHTSRLIATHCTISIRPMREVEAMHRGCLCPLRCWLLCVSVFVDWLKGYASGFCVATHLLLLGRWLVDHCTDLRLHLLCVLSKSVVA